LLAKFGHKGIEGLFREVLHHHHMGQLATES
jgi:hypothetical protein